MRAGQGGGAASATFGQAVTAAARGGGRGRGAGGGGAGAEAGSGCGAVTGRETDAPGGERGSLRCGEATRGSDGRKGGLGAALRLQTAEAGTCPGARRLSMVARGPAGQDPGWPRNRTVRGMGLGDSPRPVCRLCSVRALNTGVPFTGPAVRAAKDTLRL